MVDYATVDVDKRLTVVFRDGMAMDRDFPKWIRWSNCSAPARG